ncbi:hypothetical protein [Sinorhizobium meliloti]|uniref:hypothetical protein n=1 Tax=Rhizobium meliloti TaxID=382 RepID=UPI001F17C150|nr:hypothetical protein [Sinorhizobium meliloti]
MLLAFGAAVNAVEKKLPDRKKDIEQANHLGRALEVNMPDWFETTGDSYFKHINRTTIELAVAAARGSEAELSVRVAAKSGSENVEPLFDVRQLLLCPVRPCRSRSTR